MARETAANLTLENSEMTSVKLTNGETIENVVEVQFSLIDKTNADNLRITGVRLLQLDVTDRATRFGIDDLIKFYDGKIDHIYVWHRSNGQLCHTMVYGNETSLFDNQLLEIEKELQIAYDEAYPADSTAKTPETLVLTDEDATELYYAFRNRGHSPTLVKVAEFLKANDKRKGREHKDEWYNAEDLTIR